MKYIYSIIAVILIVSSSIELKAQEDFRKTPPKGGEMPKIDLGDYSVETLDNGLKLIVVENDKVPIVSWRLYVDYPVLSEASKAGLRDAMGNLLRSGTETKTKNEIDEAIDFIGANLNTSARGFYASSLSKYADEVLEMAADVVLNPSFPQEEVDKYIKLQESALAAYETNPDQVASQVANIVNFGKSHPFGEMLTPETLKNIDKASLRKTHQQLFSPANSYIIAVGDIDDDRAEELAEKYFGEWQGPARKVQDPKYSTDPGIYLVNMDGSVQSVIRITQPVEYEINDEDYVAAEVMNNILGGQFSSYLMQNLREDKAFTYGARSNLSPNRMIGDFVAYASVRNEVTDSAITEFLKEIRRIYEEPPSEENLILVKNALAGEFGRSLENPQVLANRALNIALYDLDEDFYKNYLKELEEVDAEDVREAAQKYLDPENLNILVVGNADEVKGSLNKFGEVKVLDVYGKPVKMQSAEAVDAAPEEIMETYINALGGENALKDLKAVKITRSASIQGQNLESVEYYEAPDKYRQDVKMAGMALSEHIRHGGDLVLYSQGQKQPVPEESKADIILASHIFPEYVLYNDSETNYEVVGMTSINGNDAYKIKITPPSGNTYTSFYDVETGFKVRDIRSQQGQNVITDYSDYVKHGDIWIAEIQSVSGMLPFPISFTVESVEIKGDIDDAMFEIK